MNLDIAFFRLSKKNDSQKNLLISDTNKFTIYTNISKIIQILRHYVDDKEVINRGIFKIEEKVLHSTLLQATLLNIIRDSNSEVKKPN